MLPDGHHLQPQLQRLAPLPQAIWDIPAPPKDETADGRSRFKTYQLQGGTLATEPARLPTRKRQFSRRLIWSRQRLAGPEHDLSMIVRGVQPSRRARD